MDEAVDGGDGDGLVREDAFPGAEWLVGGDGEAAVLVAPGDQLEEDGALGLELLHEIGGAGVEDAKAGLDQGMADGAQDVIVYR